MWNLLAAIPAPAECVSVPCQAWPQRYRLYGIMIALGVIVALELSRRRWQNRGGDPEDMSSVLLWGLPAGLIGARLYHVVTDNQLYVGHWLDNPFDANANSPFAIWQGGLGIPGGIALGVAFGAIGARRRGMRLPIALDVVAPAMALAQAIGRLGNYFNQELFGRPTTLPWGLEVSDPIAQRAGQEPGTLFHPTFLYEGLWNVSLALLLIWLDKKKVIRPGRLFALYVGGYFLGRLWVEALRADTANLIGPFRVNIWMSLIVITGVALFLAVKGLKRRPDDDLGPYDDGHRWDPELGVVPAEGALTAAGGTMASSTASSSTGGSAPAATASSSGSSAAADEQKPDAIEPNAVPGEAAQRDSGGSATGGTDDAGSGSAP